LLAECILRAETEERTSVYSLLDVKCATPARMPSDIACCDSSVVVAMVAVDEADEEDEVAKLKKLIDGLEER